MAKGSDRRLFYKLFHDLNGRGLNQNAKALYGLIHFESDGNLEWVTSMRQAGEKLEVNWETVKRCASDLVEAGLITVETVAGGRAGGETRFVLLDGNTPPLAGMFTEKPRQPSTQNTRTVGPNRPRKIRERSGRPFTQNTCTVEGTVHAKSSAVHAKSSALALSVDSKKTDLSKNVVDVDALRSRLAERAFSAADLDAIFAEFTLPAIETAEAAVDHLATSPKGVRNWRGAFVTALREGWALPEGATTFTQRADAAFQAAMEANARRRDEAERAERAAAVQAWVESIGIDRLCELFAEIPQAERRRYGFRSAFNPVVQEFLFRQHASTGNGKVATA